MQSSLPHVSRLDNRQYPFPINALSYDRIPIARHESVLLGYTYQSFVHFDMKRKASGQKLRKLKHKLRHQQKTKEI